MIREYDKRPIAAQRPYIAQTKSMRRLDVFESYIKRNDTVFPSAAEYGVPVVLERYSTETYQKVVGGLESVTDEFLEKLGIEPKEE